MNGSIKFGDSRAASQRSEAQATTHGKNGFVTATKLGTTNKIVVFGTKNFAAAPNVLLIEPNILLL